MNAPARAEMSKPLVLGLVLGAACICGAALWPRTAAAARSERSAPPAAAPPRPVVRDAEEVLARALLLVLPPEQRTAAQLGDTPTAAMLVQRAIAASAVFPQRGVRWADVDPAARRLLQRLLEQLAARCRSGDADAVLRGSERQRDELSFAWAGGERFGGACYLRLHGEHFVAEWLRLPSGEEHAAWREFADAAEPWLGARLAPVLAATPTSR